MHPSLLAPIQVQGQTLRPSISRATPHDFAEINIPITTLLVATFGTTARTFGEEVFRTLTFEGGLYRIRTWMDDHLLQVDAAMPPQAPFPTIQARASWVTGELARYAMAAELDRHYEAKHLQHLRLVGADAAFEEAFLTYQLARMVRGQWMEALRAAMALDPAHYLPSHVRTLAPGAEWNSPLGDSRSDINWAVSQISLSAPGINRFQHILVCVPNAAWEAVQDDPNIYGPNESRDPLDATVLAKKWGVRRVVLGDTATKKELDGAIVRSWGDAVLVKIDPDNPPMPIVVPRQTSIYDAFVHLNDGGSGQALEPSHAKGTTWEYPVVGWDEFAKVNMRAIALIENTNALL